MPINLESTLQGIRRGAAAPGVPGTLAGQIRAQKQKQQKQQFEMQRGLQELMMEQRQQQIDAQRNAVQSARDQAEIQEMFRNMNVRDNLAAAERLVGMDPNRIRQRIQQNPQGRLAGYLQSQNIDPTSPALGQDIKRLRNSLYARSEGDLVEGPKQQERATTAPAGTDLANILGYGEEGVVIKYVGAPPYVEDGKVVNEGNIKDYKEISGTSTEVNINQKAEAEESKEKAEARVEIAKKGLKKGEEAQQNLRNLEQLQAANESGMFTSGSLGNMRRGIGSFLELAGFNPEEISEVFVGDPSRADIIDSASNMITSRRAEELGRMTNMSLDMMKRAMPGLLKTPEGNNILVDLISRQEQKKVELGKIYRDYLLSDKSLDEYKNEIDAVEEKYSGISEGQEKLIKGATKEGSFYNPRVGIPRTEAGYIDGDSLRKGDVYLIEEDPKTGEPLENPYRLKYTGEVNERGYPIFLTEEEIEEK